MILEKEKIHQELERNLSKIINLCKEINFNKKHINAMVQELKTAIAELNKGRKTNYNMY